MRLRKQEAWCVKRMFLFVLMALAATARPITVDLDQTKTKIEFTLGDVLHTVHGTFKLTEGHFQLDAEKKTIHGQAIVDANSGNSGSGARDSRMKKNILETARYPEVTFEPTAMEGTAATGLPASVVVTGWFSIHGQRHQISIPMQVAVSGTEVTAKGRFAVPYVAWGMKNPSTFLLRVKDTVVVDVTAVGTIGPH